MQFEFNIRHFTLDDEMKEKIEKHIAKLERYAPRTPVAVRLTLTQEGGRFEADCSYYLRNSDFHGKAVASEPDLAAADAIESVERQLRRYKDRIANREKGVDVGLGEAMASAALVETEGMVVEEEGFRLKDLPVEVAIKAVQASDRPFFVFRNSASSRVAVVYRRADGAIGLLEHQD
jgi:putative sigma-54 modulation protein